MVVLSTREKTFTSHAVMTIGISAFMGLLVTYVETMVIPALPILINFFSTTYNHLSWIVTVYIISGTVSSAIFGRLADMYGKKRIFMILASVYTIAIAFGGFAQTLTQFIIVRAVQGTGMGMFPVVFALLNDQLPKERLATAQGIVSASFAGGAAIGLVIGAWITQNYGWQWSYHSAIPVSVLLVILSAIFLHDIGIKKRESIDFIGVALLTIALVFLVLAISEGQSWGWTSITTITVFTLSALFFIMFVVTEKHITVPFINLKLLKIKNVLLANFTGLFAMVALFLIYFTIPSLLQDPAPAGFGVSIFESGLIALPSSILTMFLAPFAGKITTKKGPKVSILIGTVITLFSYIALYFNRGTIFAIAEDVAIAGIGMAFIFVGIINILLLSTPKESAGESTGINVVFRNIGSSIAPALGGVYETMFVTNVMVGYLPLKLGTLPVTPILVSFPSTIAYNYTYITAIVFLAISTIFTLFMKNIIVSSEGGTKL